MNVSFIGCPCSGKTTTAAMSFAKLKEIGMPVEFVPEYARLYIAQKRLAQNLGPQDPLNLDDQDQRTIMIQQAEMEWTMAKVCGPTVTVISDTWSLAALLYMSEAGREDQIVKMIVENRILPLADLVFYAPPVYEAYTLDPNRVHDEKQSQAVDALIPQVLAKFAPKVKVIHLHGNAELRSAQVLDAIYRKLAQNTQEA